MIKRKFNIVDVIIILVVLAVICFAAYAYFAQKPDGVASETEQVAFTVMINDLSQSAASEFKAGDAVTFGESSSGNGVIENVEIAPYKKLSENKEDGVFVWSEVPDRYAVYVTVKADVTVTDYDLISGNESIAIGKNMPINAFGAASENGYIVSLTETE